MKTQELVERMLNESTAVKNSTGGTKSFRKVCDYVNLSRYYQDIEKMEEVERTPEELAEMVELQFAPTTIQLAKEVYK